MACVPLIEIWHDGELQEDQYLCRPSSSNLGDPRISHTARAIYRYISVREYPTVTYSILVRTGRAGSRDALILTVLEVHSVISSGYPCYFVMFPRENAVRSGNFEFPPE